MSYLDHPVFLCGHRKTGTTVLLCLFDSHPELLTYPADSGFFYRVFPKCENLSNEETADILAQATIRENLSSEMDVVKSPDLFDIEAISKSYREAALASEGTPAAHLRALMSAYGQHSGQSADRWKGWMEKTTSTEIYALEISEWFPNAKFIHLIRDPRDNYASLKSGWTERYQHQEDSQRALLQSLIDRGGLGLRMAIDNAAVLGPERYKVVRYEDLVKEPKRHMEELAAFIGVSYDSMLETPSVNGVPWPGNNFDGLTFNALSDVNVGRWTERMEHWEACLVEGHLSDLMQHFGYELSIDRADRVKACAQHYKWFNFLARGDAGAAV